MDAETFFEEYSDAIVKREDGCWEWTMSTTSAGYPQFTFEKEPHYGHRVAISDKLEDGDHALHHCDNKRCVNPDHLYSGDQSDNMRDSFERGTHDFSGENHNQSKLTNEDVREIRRQHETEDITQAELADEFDIDSSVISRIVRERIWDYPEAKPR